MMILCTFILTNNFVKLIFIFHKLPFIIIVVMKAILSDAIFTAFFFDFIK